MRIISVRVLPVANILAVAYAVFGFAAFLTFAFGSDEITLPFGVLAPLFHLNMNIHLGHDWHTHMDDLRYTIFLCAAAILSYAMTGWITGAVAAVGFNFVAKWTGGIDAKYVSVVNNDPSAK